MRGEDLLQAILDHPTLGVIGVDRDGRVQIVNPAIERLLGYTAGEMAAMRFIDVTHPDDRDRDWRLFLSLVEGRVEHYEIEKRYVRKDGEVRWGQLSVSPIAGEAGSEWTALGIFQDVTERKTVEGELRTERENVERLWQEASSAIAILDAEGKVFRMYSGFTRLFGYTGEEVVGQHMIDLIVPEDARQEAIANLRDAAAGRTVDTEAIRRARDGRLLNVSILGRSMRLPDGRPGLFFLFRDITDRKRLEAELERLSTTDDLTGIPNRRAFQELAEREIRRARRERKYVVLVYADLDRLKQINDTHGHAAGDRALIEFAGVLRESCRATDVYARLGGDEFAILATDETAEAAEVIPRRIRCALAELNEEEGRRYAVAVSLGVVGRVPGDDIDLDRLIAEADERMYREKRRRRVDAAAG